jgi:hypothetical protein
MAADRHLDAGVVQGIEGREIALPRNAEDVIHPMDEKLIDKDLAAGAGGRCHGGLAGRGWW